MGSDRKWTASMPLKAYDLAKTGLSEVKIAIALGINHATLVAWKKKHPEFKEALQRARRNRDEASPVESFKDYIYDKLPNYLKETWDAIHAAEQEPNKLATAELMLARAGEPARQQLFIHSLICCNFNQSIACKKIGISFRTLKSWLVKDPHFAEMIVEIDWHKKNFFEAALVQGVQNGEVSLIAMANRTYNADRGYGTKVDVQHTGGIEHTHKVVAVDDLNLPLDVRKQMLKSLRENSGPRLTEILDAQTMED